MNTPDEMKLKLAQLAVYRVKEGEMLSIMLNMGFRLGLFEAMADAAPVTPASLAATTSTHERYVLEWLYSLTAAKLVEKDGDQFRLSTEMAIVLGKPTDPAFTAGVFNGPPLPETIDRLAEAFRTGIGFSWNDHGAGVAEMQRAMGTNNKRAHLVSDVLAAMPQVIPRLEEGIRVVDIGCGAGDLAHRIAEAFPKSTVLGVDPSVHAIEMANQLQTESDLPNLSYCEGTFDDLPADSADLLTTFDVLHDVPFPQQACDAARAAVTDGGDWIVADIKAGPDFESNRKIPTLPLFYAMSVMYCMNSAMSEPGGAGLGTLGLSEDVLRGFTTTAGFETVDRFEFDFDVNNAYYLVR